MKVVNRLEEQIGEVKTFRAGAETTLATVTKQLGEISTKMDGLATFEAKATTAVGFVKWLVGVSGVTILALIGSLVAGAVQAGKIHSAIEHHGEKLAGLQDTTKETGKQIAELEKAVNRRSEEVSGLKVAVDSFRAAVDANAEKMQAATDRLANKVELLGVGPYRTQTIKMYVGKEKPQVKEREAVYTIPLLRPLSEKQAERAVATVRLLPSSGIEPARYEGPVQIAAVVAKDGKACLVHLYFDGDAKDIVRQIGQFPVELSISHP